MKNRKFSLREKLTVGIVKRFATDLIIEPSTEHPGLYDASFKIDNWHGRLIRFIDPKRFYFADK